MSKKETNSYEPDASYPVGKISLTDSTRVRVRVNTKDDKNSVDIRIWYKTKAMTEFGATAKGVSLPISQIDDMIALLEKAKRVISKNKLK